MFSLTLALGPGADLTLGGDSVNELFQAFTDLGGEPGSLAESAKEAVQKFMDGTLEAQLVRVDGDAAAFASAQSALAGESSEGEERWPSDEAVARGSEIDSEPEVVNDPWGVGASTSKPAASNSGPRGGNSAPRSRQRERPAGPQASGTYKTSPADDRYGRVFTINLPNAPQCNCPEGKTAVQMRATSQKTGKPYSQWVCPENAPGGDWRNKCDFREFPN